MTNEDGERDRSAEEDVRILSSKAENSGWFEALLNKYKHMLVGLARKYYLVGGGDAADLTQEAMFRFYRAAMSYDPTKNASFKTYATVCVRNHLTDVMRKNLGAANAFNRVITPLEYDGGEEERPNITEGYYPDPLTNYIREESDRAVSAEAKRLLSPRQLAVLTMYVDGYSYMEIADRLGINVKSVDNALTAAKNKLKKRLSDKKEDNK